MGATEVTAYEQAKTTWDAAGVQVHHLAAEILQVGESMRDNPLRFMVSNVEGGAGSGLSLSSNITLDGRRWPTSQVLMNVTNELRETTFAVRNAWAALSEEEQGQVDKAEGAII